MNDEITDETNMSGYKAAVEKIQSKTHEWDSYLARKPSLEAVQALADKLTTDEEAMEEFRVIGGKTISPYNPHKIQRR